MLHPVIDYHGRSIVQNFHVDWYDIFRTSLALNDWTLNIEKKNHQSVAYIDFAKAFDSVCHNKLLLKLTAYGICGSRLNWISSFLSHRFCQTRIGNCLSSALPILSGVVQGSCLGPVLHFQY